MFSLQTLTISPFLRAAYLHTYTSWLGLLFHRQILDRDRETSTLSAEGIPVGPVREKGREAGNVGVRGREGQGAEVWDPWWEGITDIHAEWVPQEGRNGRTSYSIALGWDTDRRTGYIKKMLLGSANIFPFLLSLYCFFVSETESYSVGPCWPQKTLRLLPQLLTSWDCKWHLAMQSNLHSPALVFGHWTGCLIPLKL